MSQANRALWIAALRSGEYKQCSSYLARGEGFCCLGVACEVAMKNGVEINKVIEEGSVSYDYETAVPPYQVANWLGFKDRNPKIKSGRFLADLNDTDGMSFEQIANVIEGGHLEVKEEVETPT